MPGVVARWPPAPALPIAVICSLVTAAGGTPVCAAPQAMRIAGLVLEATGTRVERHITMRINAVLADGGSRAIEDELLTNAMRVHVTDRSGVDATVALTGCTRSETGIVCAGATHRARLKRIDRGERYRLRIAASTVSTDAGTERPVGPAQVALLRTGGADRVDIISDCKETGTAGLSCRDVRRPNIVFIVTDDQRWDTLQYMPRTIERLAAHGVSFTNAFATTPLCGPSRASMLTGQYAHTHGVLTNAGVSGGASAFEGPDASTLATWLHDAGYRTGMYGKYMVGYAAQCPPARVQCYQPPGWDEWHVFWTQHYYDYKLQENGVTVSYQSDPSEYSTDVITAKSVDFINAAQGQPFFLHIGYHAPHGEISGFAIAADRHDGVFRGLPPLIPRALSPWQPPNWNEDIGSDKPPWMSVLPDANDIVSPVLTFAAYGEAVRLLQLEAALAVDDGIDAIVRALENTGQADNTVIVLTSDNGLLWGEHRIYGGKDYPYEESVRIPLVVRYPRLIKAAREESALVANIDLAPTLARLAGLRPPTTVDGIDLRPLLRQEVSSVRDGLLLEWWNLRSVQGLPTYVGVRTEEWKYIEYPSAAEAELYDMLNDSYELENRAHDASFLDVVTAEKARVATLLDGPLGK